MRYGPTVTSEPIHDRWLVSKFGKSPLFCKLGRAGDEYPKQFPKLKPPIVTIKAK